MRFFGNSKILNYNFNALVAVSRYTFSMRQTISKQKLFYHKKLRWLERKKWDLEKQVRESQTYMEIPRILVGYKVQLALIDSMRNKDEGLSEAIAASTSFLTFSEKPFRLCNLKSNRTIFDNLPWQLNKHEKMEAMFFKNKIYQKGHLELLDISEHHYKKLSPNAQKYFVQGLKEFDRLRHPIFIYHPRIPKSYLREGEEKLYWNYLAVPDSSAESEAKKIDNWLDIQRECELWHYEGCRTRNYYKWDSEDRRKKERLKLKDELRKLNEEIFFS